MTEARAKPGVRRGRIFPEIQWTEEKRAQWRSQQEAVRQRCRPVFDRLQPELMATHYNWYLAVEPETLEYFIDNNKRLAVNKLRDRHPDAIPFVFRINETGTCGTIAFSSESCKTISCLRHACKRQEAIVKKITVIFCYY